MAAGATEIDMVIDRGRSWPHDYGKVFDEITAVKEQCGRAHLKVILETGELVTYDNVRRASWLALHAGADFIKTSTGKVSPAATLPVTLIMLEAVRDYRAATGRQAGVKPRLASVPPRTPSATWCWSRRSPGTTGWTPRGSGSARRRC